MRKLHLGNETTPYHSPGNLIRNNIRHVLLFSQNNTQSEIRKPRLKGEGRTLAVCLTRLSKQFAILWIKSSRTEEISNVNERKFIWYDAQALDAGIR